MTEMTPVTDPQEDGFPILSCQFLRELALRPLAEVTVNFGGILLDVCGADYDADRDKMVLRVLPEDLADAIRRLISGAPAEA